jgi:hypothetical protein
MWEPAGNRADLASGWKPCAAVTGINAPIPLEFLGERPEWLAGQAF